MKFRLCFDELGARRERARQRGLQRTRIPRTGRGRFQAAGLSAIQVGMAMAGVGAAGLLSGCSLLYRYQDTFDLAPTVAPLLVGPVNGANTGSIHAPGGAAIADQPLQPRFTWLEVAGATRYEVQLDDECPVEGYPSCTFPSPITASTNPVGAPSGPGLIYRPASDLPVSTVQPVGTRYAWRVRACHKDDCGPWSEARYLNVGRQDRDFNGDGYADVAVGTLQSEVYVYHGSPTGTASVPDVTLLDPATSFGDFGTDIAAAGDLNGDGYADLLVTHSTAETLYVYHGGAGGVPTAPSTVITRTVGGFGVAVTGAGDLDGDGYTDVAVGADNGTAAHVFHGSATGIGDVEFTVVAPVGYEGSFGWFLDGAGDVNGDGQADLIISAFFSDAVFLYNGDAARAQLDPTTLMRPATAPASYVFGAEAVGVGDVNGDGFGDFAITGGPTVPGDSSHAYLYTGRRDVWNLTAGTTLQAPAAQDGWLGVSIAGGGDLDGDGFADLVLGAPYASNPENGEGNALVFYGAASGVRTDPPAVLDNPTNQTNGSFGFDVRIIGDLDGDGFADLAVGAIDQSTPETQEGAAYFFRGGSTGIEPTPSLALDNPLDLTLGGFGAPIARTTPREGRYFTGAGEGTPC